MLVCRDPPVLAKPRMPVEKPRSSRISTGCPSAVIISTPAFYTNDRAVFGFAFPHQRSLELCFYLRFFGTRKTQGTTYPSGASQNTSVSQIQ